MLIIAGSEDVGLGDLERIGSLVPGLEAGILVMHVVPFIGREDRDHQFAEPWVAGLTGLKQELEEIPMEATKLVSWAEGTAPVDDTAVFEIYIKTTPEKLWQAITDPALRAKYSFGVGVSSDWTPGSTYQAGMPGVEISAGENIEVDPPRLLVQSFNALWSDEVKAEGPTRVTWEIEQVGTSCRLTVVHSGLRPGANEELYGGWPMILSGLKTLLETGEQLDTPGSLMYADNGAG